MDWIDDALRKQERDEEAWLSTRPICDYCSEPIRDDEYYEINHLDICPDCIDEYLEKECLRRISD